jgi:hypothetical protein
MSRLSASIEVRDALTDVLYVGGRRGITPAASAIESIILTRTGTLFSPNSGNKATMLLILRKAAAPVSISAVLKANIQWVLS